MSQIEVKLDGIGKRYDGSDTLSVRDFNIEIKKGEFIVFVGPSGCGKTTSLRMIAGLEKITEGELYIGDRLVNNVHPKDRDIAMVFQNYALYPHMSVRDNISYGLKVRKIDKAEIDEKVEWAADILGLTDYLDRKPKDLSGGQRQRVALGRAIVRDPKVFLMDEPLSNLDAKLRVSMRNEIIKLHKRLEATSIYVTHDQVEAMTMADRVVLMSMGEVQQIGTPMELFNHPKNIFVASFIGAPQMNFFDVEVTSEGLTIEGAETIELPEGIRRKLNKEGKLIMGIRPQHIKTSSLELEAYQNEKITLHVEHVEEMGTETYIYSTYKSKKIIVKTHESYKVDNKHIIEVAIDINKAHFFDPETERNCFDHE